MNQNGIRQITPEEIARAEGIPLTTEELQKTQVLNLKEVEETARFEKITSKKPAIIVAIIGALFITFGTTFQVAKTMTTKTTTTTEERNVVTEEPVVEEKEPLNEISYLNCNRTTLNNPDGTDTIYTILYTFENDQLIGFTKTFHVTATPNNPMGPVTVQNYLRDYQPFLNPTEGYEITVDPIDNGLITTVQVDYYKLDLTLLNPVQQNHFTTKLDYPLYSTRDEIAPAMVTYGFQCE